MESGSRGPRLCEASPPPCSPSLPPGEVRAHLLPSKACRPPRKSGLPSADPQPLPPPLPKKTLSRTQSLPSHRAPSRSPAPERQPRRPFLGSHSVDERQADGGQARPACPLAERPFSSLDTSLGLSWHDLSCLEATRAVLEARQLEGLRTVHSRLEARLLGGHPGPCHPGHDFRLLDSSPYVESGDALYYRMVRVGDESWHLLAAKVSPAPAPPPPKFPAFHLRHNPGHARRGLSCLVCSEHGLTQPSAPRFSSVGPLACKWLGVLSAAPLPPCPSGA